MQAIFVIDKELKHSRRYAAEEDNDFPIKTVYVDRSFSDGENSLEITVRKLNKGGN